MKDREIRRLNDSPWTRTLGKLAMEVSTQGWTFPAPLKRPLTEFSPTG